MKISGFLICVEVITYLVLDNLHECTFKYFAGVQDAPPTFMTYLVAAHQTCTFIAAAMSLTRMFLRTHLQPYPA